MCILASLLFHGGYLLYLSINTRCFREELEKGYYYVTLVLPAHKSIRTKDVGDPPNEYSQFSSFSYTTEKPRVSIWSTVPILNKNHQGCHRRSHHHGWDSPTLRTRRSLLRRREMAIRTWTTRYRT